MRRVTSFGWRRPAMILAIVCGASACGAVAAPLVGSASSTGKPYALSITPTSVVAGESTGFSISLKNEATPQSLGSVNLTPPAGFTATSSTLGTVVNGVVDLRNLNLASGATDTFTVTVSAPCAGTGGVWTAVAKQANDFSGPPGNDFTLDTVNSSGLTTTLGGGCQLAFATAPADATVGATITGTPLVTSSNFVAVEVLNGAGQLVTSSTIPVSLQIAPGSPLPGAGAVLSGGGPVNAVGGIATFTTPSISVHGVYELLASSSAVGVASVTSGPFNIWDSAGGCGVGQSCEGSSTIKNVMSSVVQGQSGSGGFLTLSLGENMLSCGDSFNHAPSTTTVSQVGYQSAQPKTVTLTVFKSELMTYKNSGLSFWAVCYGSNVDFTSASGTPAPLVNGLYTALLPECSSTQPAPCVQSISKNPANDIVEVVSVPPGDPQMG